MYHSTYVRSLLIAKSRLTARAGSPGVTGDQSYSHKPSLMRTGGIRAVLAAAERRPRPKINGWRIDGSYVSPAWPTTIILLPTSVPPHAPTDLVSDGRNH